MPGIGAANFFFTLREPLDQRFVLTAYSIARGWDNVLFFGVITKVTLDY